MTAKRRGKLCTQFTKAPATVHTVDRAQRSRYALTRPYQLDRFRHWTTSGMHFRATSSAGKCAGSAGMISRKQARCVKPWYGDDRRSGHTCAVQDRRAGRKRVDIGRVEPVFQAASTCFHSIGPEDVTTCARRSHHCAAVKDRRGDGLTGQKHVKAKLPAFQDRPFYGGHCRRDRRQ